MSDTEAGAAMVNHDLKTWPEYFFPVKSGFKTFEVRKNDRGFQVGDLLTLRLWQPAGGYVGDSCIRRVTYVLEGGQFGIEPGYCVLGLAVIPSSREESEAQP